MASINPLKRASDSPESAADEPLCKKRRTDSLYRPQTPPAEVLEVRSKGQNGDTVEQRATEPRALPSENGEMDITLKRSIAIALKHVGFESASPGALEAFAMATQRYVSEILSQVTVSAVTSRRLLPIPTDWITGLEQMNINPTILQSHENGLPNELKPPLRLENGLPKGLKLPLRPQYLPQDPVPPPHVDHIAAMNPALGGAADKASKKYVPKKFPTFPALHTYKFTEYYPFEREQDISKIREKGAQDRRLVEVVLGNHATETQSEGRPETSNKRIQKRHELWEGAFRNVPGENTVKPNVSVVNAAARYGYLRKARPVTKKPSAENQKVVGTGVMGNGV